jgi:dTDP-4-dehydrorhamnose 3,5-epimerase
MIHEHAVRETRIEGLLVVDMKTITDGRGEVREFFRASDWPEASFGAWRQLNVTTTIRGAIRGLHGEAMAKLVGIVSGEAFGVYLDTRPGPGFGTLETLDLSLGRQVLVPPGVCNGFQTTSERSVYVYCFDDEWTPGMAGVAVSPMDPDLDIAWPIEIDPDDDRLLSAKDRAAPPLRSLG